MVVLLKYTLAPGKALDRYGVRPVMFSVGALLGPLLAGAMLPVLGLGGLYLTDAICLTAKRRGID